MPDVQEMGIEMKGTRRGDKRWGDTKGGKVMVRGKKKKKKCYYLIWAANDASESLGLALTTPLGPLVYLRPGIDNLGFKHFRANRNSTYMDSFLGSLP